MVIREIEAKSILTESHLPESDYCVNPYVGCAHGCVYCYARFMKRFTGHTEPWGEFVDIKVNAVELLRQRSRSIRDKRGVVLLGSVTDAYQPLERKYRLTRGLLQELLLAGFPVSILTKSDLVVRDIDILRQFEDCTVGITVTSMNDLVRAKLEPNSTSVDRRIAALRQLHENGISTYVFVGPIFPILTDLRAIFNGVQGSVDAMWGEALNIRGGNWPGLEAALRESFPDTLPGLREAAQNPVHWDKVEQEFRDLCAEFRVPLVGFYRH